MTSSRSPTVARVLAGELCTGCGLCASVAGGAIRMETQAPGYSRPVVEGPVSDAAERTIAEACPGSKVAPWSDHDPAAVVDPYWGPIITCATGHATDAEIRHKGASGGAITALAVHALESGLVDRVVQITANEADPIGNRVVVSRTRDEIVTAAGSRYVSSSPLVDIEAVLAEGGALAFIGKPCDVSALRQLGRRDPRVALHVRLTLAFYCAGIPSRRAVGRVLDAMGAPQDEVTAFRYRGHGWPGKATAVRRDGSSAEMSYEESWGGYLSHEVQFRCKICPDAVGGVADIACADAWYGGESGYPKFEELDGRSLVVSRTSAGDAFLAGSVAAGALSTEPLDLREIDLMQPSQAARKRLALARMLGVRTLGRPTPDVSGLEVAAAARRAPLKLSAKNYMGTIRRAVQGRLSAK